MEEILSLIIPVSKDARLRRCLESLPDWLKIIVVLNNHPSEEVIAIASADVRCRVLYCGDTSCSLAQACNQGIVAATTDYVMFLDPDCVASGTLFEEIRLWIGQYDILKARVSFAVGSRFSWLVANVRTLHHQVFNDGRSLFAPGLIIRVDSCHQIGGYFFDERISWGEDGELSSRLLRSNLTVRYLVTTIWHDQESIIHDLRGAFRIGVGEYELDRFHRISLFNRLSQDFAGLTDRRRRSRVALQHFGIVTALYFLAWKTVVRCGYYQALCFKRKE